MIMIPLAKLLVTIWVIYAIAHKEPWEKEIEKTSKKELSHKN